MDGNVSATTNKEVGREYSSLVDAKVRLHGNEAPLFNSNSQMIDTHLLFPNFSMVEVVEPMAGDPFQRSTILIDDLLRWIHVSEIGHRVHLRGRVTMQRPGVSLCIRDATRGICAQTTQDTRLALGDEVDIAGFAGAENATPFLANAVFRKIGDDDPVAAKPITANEAMLGKFNSELVQIDGQVIGHDLASSDTTLMLTSGNFIFTAILPKSITGSEASQWANGSGLRITGICSIQVDSQLSEIGEGLAVTKSFRILMRSPADVVIVRRPSWWSAGHVLVLLALALAATLCVLVWVAALRRRLQQQTETIRESERQFRHLAEHDTLTGLVTRAVLQDRLNVALQSARHNHSGLALLMLDVDKFKQINDTLGHLGGDAVLRVTAARLAGTVRKTDTVARMGGDEFVLILNELNDPDDATRFAQKVVRCLAAPIPFEGREVPVSVSVGVHLASAGELDAETLLQGADHAMYRAKNMGRNCYQLYHPGAHSSETERQMAGLLPNPNRS